MNRNSLKTRFLQMLAVSIFLCFLLISFVIRISWKASQYSRVETSLAATLHDITARLDSKYAFLLQISQNMIPSGLIGRKYNEFLTDRIQYDRFNDYKEFINSLNIASFGIENVVLSSYFRPGIQDVGPKKIIYSSLSVSQKYDPETLLPLLYTDEITFHPMHSTYASILDKDVVSVMRPFFFYNGLEAMVYIEVSSEELDYLRNRSELENTSYAFLQMNMQYEVVYSNTQQFSLGDRVSVDQKGMVNQGHWIGVCEKSEYGFYNVLLIPWNEYSYQTNQWIRVVIITVLISLSILAVVSFSQIWLFTKPLKALEKEMAGLGDGNFSVSEYHFNLKEFDRLFEVFNRMKRQISLLMEENRKKEKEKSRLELEKLEYQINPHFLMNALNSVHWMAIADHAEDIDSYVKRLGNILSYSLGKVNNRTTLRTELDALENYLQLQQTTYDFAYSIEVEEGEYLDWECARFILQPVAENAVCHNMDEFGYLWVRIWKEDKIHIVIRDDGKGFVMTAEEEDEESEERGRKKGIGLRYVKMTLDAIYGDKAGLTIESKIGEGTEVCITLPGGDCYVSCINY